MLMMKEKLAGVMLVLVAGGIGAGEPGQEKRQVPTPPLEQAEKDFKIGEFYRRTGHPGSARFFCALVQRRHPNTKCARLATQCLQQLKPEPVMPKADGPPPARVGQIFPIGNTKTRDRIILSQVGLFPGGILEYPALKEAERNLRRLGIFENDPAKSIRPNVPVIEPDPPSEYKDILIRVQEKK